MSFDEKLFIYSDISVKSSSIYNSKIFFTVYSFIIPCVSSDSSNFLLPPPSLSSIISIICCNVICNL